MSLATDTFNGAVAEMVDRLSSFLPPITDPPPHSTLALLEANARPVGVGNWQGHVERGGLALLGVRGGRVEARVRFDVRGPTPVEAAQRALALQATLRTAPRDAVPPLTGRFLVLEPDGGDAPHLLSDEEDWIQSLTYRALYEYRYEDTDEAGSVIVRVPLNVRGEHHEDDLVTRDVARWDREAARPMRARGPRRIGELSALSLPAGGLPAGTVTLLRTHDGAAGAPAAMAPPTPLADFGAALRGGGRHHQYVFASLADFLDEFVPAGEDVTLAGLDGAAAAYEALRAGPALRAALRDVPLAGPGERFEVIYHNPALPPGGPQRFPDPDPAAAGEPGESSTVLYLRAGRGLAA